MNCLVHMSDRKKKRRVLHVNMLQKWQQPRATVFLAQEAMEDGGHEEIPAWNELDEDQPKIRGKLSPDQAQELRDLLAWYEKVFHTLPGHRRCSTLYQDTQLPQHTR